MTGPNPERRIATNIETWRKGATQIVTVRHGTSGGIHAEMVATSANHEITIILLHELARTRPYDERIYAIGPNGKTAVAPKEAIRRAVEDYILGGNGGYPGQLM